MQYPNGDVAQYVILAFQCIVEGGSLRPDQVETVALHFWSASEASTLSLAPWLRSVLSLVYSSGDVAGFQPANWQPPSTSESDLSEQAS